MQPRDPDFVTRVRASFEAQKFMASLGASLHDVEPGSVRIEMPFLDAATQQHGFVHAGAIASIADSAAGYAALTLMPPGAAVLTVEYKINLLAPAVGERFSAEGRVRKAGRTLTLSAADVVAHRGDERRLVASLVATIMTVEGRGLTD